MLSTSIECKVVRINNEQILRVGGLILKSDCASIMEECAHILEKLNGTKGYICTFFCFEYLSLVFLVQFSGRLVSE